ncbi:cytochrome P450 [Inquilinus limosus]|uniref:cytochrome P450 n=1 Tax=Inquilinus limosus TaxID=171674 RepID=UPI003F17BFE5
MDIDGSVAREPVLVGGAMPILGHAWHLMQDPLGFLESLRDHGDLVRIRLGPKVAYAACSPDLVGSLLLAKTQPFIVGGPLWDTLEALIGKGVATSNGAEHLRQRRMILPAFRREQIANYAPVMVEEAGAIAERWKPGGIVNVRDEMFRLTVRIISRSLLVLDSVGRSADVVGAALRPVFLGMYRQMVLSAIPLPRLPTPGNRRFDRALATLHRVVDDIIRERRASDMRHDDLLTTLIEARDEETGEPLSDQEVHDNVVSVLVAGAEAPSATLAWVFHLLSQHPAEEARLHRELEAVLGDRPVGFDDLPRLPHTRNVVTESMRIRQATWIFTRRATADTDLGGYRIPAGADVLYSPYAIQRDRRSFDRPSEFVPDRWDPERAAIIPKYAMLPFSAGSRKCPGDHFSMTEITLALATIASRWRLVPVASADATPQPGITLHPKKLLMRAEPR